MPHHRKTPADIRREALIQVGLRAPNTRQFTLDDDYARTRCHPPSLLPKFPHYAPRPLIWEGDQLPLPPGLRWPKQRRE